MLRIAIVASLSLSSSVALAKECKSLVDYKKTVADVVAAGTALAKAQGSKVPNYFVPDTYNDKAFSPAQFHVLEGVYLMDPRTPEGLPKADGAILATMKGSKDLAAVLWTIGGKVCDEQKVSKRLLSVIGAVKTAPGEKVDDIKPDEDKSL